MQALRCHPRNADVLASLGILELGADWDRASAYLRSALQVDPRHQQALATYREQLECYLRPGTSAQESTLSTTDEDEDGDVLECAESNRGSRRAEGEEAEEEPMQGGAHERHRRSSAQDLPQTASPSNLPNDGLTSLGVPVQVPGGASGDCARGAGADPQTKEESMGQHPLSRAASARRAQIFAEYLRSAAADARAGNVGIWNRTTQTSASVSSSSVWRRPGEGSCDRRNTNSPCESE